MENNKQNTRMWDLTLECQPTPLSCVSLAVQSLFAECAKEQ